MFEQAQDIVRAFSSRNCGNMSLFYGETKDALANRKIFLQGLGVDYRDLACAKQVHAHNVRYIQSRDKGRGALGYEDSVDSTDALVTDEKGIPLAVFTADCLSIFLHDPSGPAIGIAHAGWRSSRENICQKTISFMRDRLGAKAEDIRLSLGPCIRKCCYAVGSDFPGFFPAGALDYQGGRYYLDLARVNIMQALQAGVRQEHISDSGICTSCRSHDFFSFRREGSSCGRMISVIMLK
jgi:YfiH family protein